MIVNNPLVSYAHYVLSYENRTSLALLYIHFPLFVWKDRSLYDVTVVVKQYLLMLYPYPLIELHFCMPRCQIYIIFISGHMDDHFLQLIILSHCSHEMYMVLHFTHNIIKIHSGSVDDYIRENEILMLNTIGK